MPTAEINTQSGSKSSASNSSSWFSIQGNIKQGLLPYVIDPEQPLNKIAGFNAENASPQLFTFRKSDESPGGTACLGFYPMTSFPLANESEVVNASGMDDDISLKLLYQSQGIDGIASSGPVTVDDLFSNLPSVSIRQFLPDTRLDQCLNFFKDLFGEMSKLFVKAKDVGKGQPEDKKFTELMKSIWNCACFTIQYMTGMREQSFVTDFMKFAEEAGSTRLGPITLADNQKVMQYVHDFPYILYYRLQSCTTTNIYRIPAMCEGKPIMSSDGMPGWGDGSDFMGAGGFRVSGLLDKIPIVGQLAQTMLGNIGINYMPWWNAESGAKTAAPDVTIKFDLFNDNVVKAVKNFVFVNTIVPSNRWIQYNMFQHSSDLYDVKIDGVDRLFACSGKFEVAYDGVLRNPPQKFMKLLKGHVNTSAFGDAKKFIDAVNANNMIKIPDVYKVTMSFKSLLPANFNNYMYSYSKNINHMVAYRENVRDNTLGKALGQTVYKFGKLIGEVFDKGLDDNAINRASTMINEELKQRENADAEAKAKANAAAAQAN